MTGSGIIRHQETDRIETLVPSDVDACPFCILKVGSICSPILTGQPAEMVESVGKENQFRLVFRRLAGQVKRGLITSFRRHKVREGREGSVFFGQGINVGVHYVDRIDRNRHAVKLFFDFF